ncbi:MAG: PilZ domain-containing protein, partial [Myxococcota bacterium]
NDVSPDSPERDAIESALLGLESTGDSLEETYEPILELRMEMLERREALCVRVSEDVQDFEGRLGRASDALSGLRQRAESEAARARSVSETPTLEAERPASEPPAQKSAPLPVPIEESATAQPSDSVIDVAARITLESEDNFYDGLDEGRGVFVSTIEILPLGQRVHVRIDVEGVHSVNAHGVVRWYRDWDDDQPQLHPGMGIEFAELGDDDLRVVEDFISRRDPWLFI